jgi:hypothetical protein
MRVPLIVCARPSVETIWPSVRIGRGQWTIEHDGQDSEFSVLVNGSESNTETLVLSDHAEVQVKFTKKGNESSITVFVCLTP